MYSSIKLAVSKTDCVVLFLRGCIKTKLVFGLDKVSGRHAVKKMPNDKPQTFGNLGKKTQTVKLAFRDQTSLLQKNCVQTYWYKTNGNQ